VPVWGQEFKPYPEPRITEEQWQSYFDEVQSKYGRTARVAPNQPLVVFDDGTSTQYAFTQRGHSAHPAWIARKVVQDSRGTYIDQVGYFAGDEKAFTALSHAFRALDHNVREYVNGQSEVKSK
jgi:hypothetical protein